MAGIGSFVRELRRRRVFRVAVIYIVSAWVVIQVASEAFPGLEIPEAAIRHVWLGAILGFPVALVFGWFYDITSHGLVRTPPADPARASDLSLKKSDYVILAALVAVAVGIIYELTEQIRLTKPPVSTIDQESIAVPPLGALSGDQGAGAQTTVAVLPFADLSPDADKQYFADGVHDEIIARLSEIQALDVKSRTSVMAYRDPEANIRHIGAELGADAVIEGSVRYAEGKVRVTAQLIDTRSDTHLWTRSFDRALTLENLFGIQTEIAEHVAAGLKTRLSAGADGRSATLPTEDLGAYEAFLLGKYHYRQRQPDDLYLSVQHFQKAVRLDPAFAEAWDWLAYAWNHAGVQQGWTTPSEAYPKARAAALRALELDPGLATARALLAFLRAVYDWEWEAAVRDLERAVKQDPEDTGTVWSYAYVLALLGRHDEAIRQVETLANASPDVPRLRQQVAYRLSDAGRFRQAIAAGEEALTLGADAGQIYDLLGVAYVGLGELDQAIEHFEQAAVLQGRSAGTLGHLAAAFARAGRTDRAREILAELEAQQSSSRISPVTLAQVHAALGDSDTALTLLEQAVAERMRGVLGVGHDPFFESLRGDPRLQALVERTGLALAR